MGDLKRPEKLPEEFGGIWNALREADEQSPSRQALALKLGVSTHTIQRILVDGSVPLLSETGSTRVRRAWVRILTRLAMNMDREPREWIEAVGIPFDDDMAGISEAEAIKVMARRNGSTYSQSGTARRVRPMTGVMATAPGIAWPAEIRAGLMVRGTLASNLESHGGSFLEVFLQRLVGAVNPGTRLGIQHMEEDAIVRDLLTRGTKLDVGAGIAGTVHRCYLGLTFVPIPGIITRLGAFCLKTKDRAGAVPDWREAVSPGRVKNRHFLVPAGDVAHEYLQGQCGIAPEEIVTIKAAGPDRIARALLKETRSHPDKWVIFVGGDDRCALIADSLESRRGSRKTYSVEYLSGAQEDCPRYPVGIALRTGAGPWASLLEAARDDELLGASRRRTARLYASLLIASFLDRNPAGLPEVLKTRGMIGITDFEKATPEFQEVLFRNLVLELKQVLLARLDLEGTAESADALDSRATERAAAYAEALIPRGWLRVIEAPLMRSEGVEAHGSARPAISPVPGEWPHWCQSCSISLEDEHNRGGSDRFCRFCSDEEGRLKSRSKVQNLIARWFERWQENLNHDEALMRAGLFMRAMPAWSDN
jgi:hypothetical protein